MVLVNCEECGKNISDKAKSCPGCGAPLGKPQSHFEVDARSTNNTQLRSFQIDKFSVIYVVLMTIVICSVIYIWFGFALSDYQELLRESSWEVGKPLPHMEVPLPLRIIMFPFANIGILRAGGDLSLSWTLGQSFILSLASYYVFGKKLRNLKVYFFK